MKKNLFSIAIIACASFSIILSSCSMMKRHYTKGYFVSHNSGKIDNDAQAQNLQTKKSESPSYTEQYIYAQSSVNDDPTQNLLTEDGAIIASNKNIKSESKPVIPSKKYMAYSTTAMGYTKENPKSFNAKKTQDNLAADALSLFWIIVIILLILWLIAILTGGWGLGGYVHIILVVALILLILWLLRII